MIRDRLAYFYTNSPPHFGKRSPESEQSNENYNQQEEYQESQINEISQQEDQSQEMDEDHYRQKSAPEMNNFNLRKVSIGSYKNASGEYSISTSPFNKDTYTTSSKRHSTNQQYQSEIRQEDIENWNEEDLYNLSQENSKETNPQEIIEVETPTDEVYHNQFGATVTQETDMNKYIVDNQPHHNKGVSSIYSQNTNDLNKLLYSHKRDASNGMTSSYKYSELFMSNQASFNDQFKSMRVSEDMPATNYVQNQWNMYGREKEDVMMSNEQVHYIGPTTLTEEMNGSLEYQLTNSKGEETEEDQYDGMNFEEYYKSATKTGENHVQIDNKLSISDEQRENLMKRIMLLKMQQNHSQSDEDNNFELSKSEQKDGVHSDEPEYDEAEGETQD